MALNGIQQRSATFNMSMFLSFGIARSFSMAIDGMPADVIVAAIVLEMIIGLAGVFALLKYQETI